MKLGRTLKTLAWAALWTMGSLTFALESGLVTRSVTPDLASLPRRLGPFEVQQALDFDLAALGEDPPEEHVYLEVRDDDGRTGRLFLAYYARSQRWSGRPHDLEGCFAAAGWRESQAERVARAPFPWSRRFEQPGQAIRVIHWIDHPGSETLELDGRALVTRLTQARGLRTDVVSAYFEFPAEDAPGEEALSAAAAAVSNALEARW